MKKSGWIFIIPAAFFLSVNFAVSSVKTLFISRSIYFFFFISLFFLLRRFNINKILKSVVGGVSSIIFFYGIIQKFILFPYYLQNLSPGDNFYSRAIITRIKSGRIFSIFTLPTLYAIVCAVLILFIFHYLLKSRDLKNRIFWSFLIFLGLFNLILTQSFGGILCLSVGILLYLILSGILKMKYLVPAVMVLALFFFLITGLRFSEARELEPVKLRISNWKQSLRMIGASPLFGLGLGNYEAKISYFTYPGEARSIFAHNFFLQFPAEVGVILPFFILLLLFLFRRHLKLRNFKDEDKTVYISGFFILLFYNLVDIGFYFFAAGIAGVVCLSQIYPRKTGKFRLNIVFLILLSALMLVENISETYQRRGEFWFNQNDYHNAEINYKKSLKINPYNLRALMGCAKIHYDRRDYAGAEYCINKVLNIYPDSSFANALKTNIVYRQRKYFSSLYHARTAANKNRLNRIHKRQYENIKNSLQAELTKPEN